MLSDLIPGYPAELARLAELGPSGHTLGLNFTYRGPEILETTFPDEWRKIYEDRNYFVLDPVLVWLMTHDGFCRWSEIRLPDVRRVMQHSKKYGLHYGGAFSRKVAGKRSFLTISRPDRELTDEEMTELNERFSRWVDLAHNKASLTIGELDVLRCFRDGLGQGETAETLGISESTVKQRALKACAKLGAATRTQAVATAVMRKYI